MEVNSNRSNSMTSVGSTGSTDSGFGVNDGQSPVGHMGPKSVTTAPANQKPLGFFGWLKSLLFGGSSNNSSEKTPESFTVSPKFSQKIADQDPIGDEHDASARTAAIDDNIEAIEILAQKYPANKELQSILKDAERQSKIASTLNEKDSLDHDDLVGIKDAFDRVIDYTKQAATVDRRESMKDKASGQLAALDKSKSIELQHNLMPPAKESGLFEQTVELKKQNQRAVFKDEREFRDEYKKLDDAVQSAKGQFGERSEQVTQARAERQQHIDDHPQFKYLFGNTIPESQAGVKDVAAAIDTTGLGSRQTQQATQKRQERFRPSRF